MYASDVAMAKVLIWPVVLMVGIVTLGFTAGSWFGNSAKTARDGNDLRRDELIVQECADEEDRLTCAEQLRGAMEVTPERLDSDG